MLESEETLAEMSFGNIDFELKRKRSVQEKRSHASTCRICLSCLMEPARLVCGHTFCEHCLNTYWKSNEEPEFVVCPLCRGFAFQIGFSEKDKVNSTRDLRRKFDPEHSEEPVTQQQTDFMNRLLESIYWKIWPIIMPIVMIVVSIIRPFLLDLSLMF